MLKYPTQILLVQLRYPKCVLYKLSTIPLVAKCRTLPKAFSHKNWNCSFLVLTLSFVANMVCNIPPTGSDFGYDNTTWDGSRQIQTGNVSYFCNPPKVLYSMSSYKCLRLRMFYSGSGILWCFGSGSGRIRSSKKALKISKILELLTGEFDNFQWCTKWLRQKCLIWSKKFLDPTLG
jgi:hypothetical protein